MSQGKIIILGIETSCDETAAAVAISELSTVRLLSNVVASQIDLHVATGGVVPEVAARAHVEAIIPTIERALELLVNKIGTANRGLVSKVRHSPDFLTSEGKKPEWPNQSRTGDLTSIFNAIDAIAVTTGPGLIGSLLIGIETAKTLAYVFGKPIVPINHLEGHVYANFVSKKLEVRSSPKLPDCLTSEGGQPEWPNQRKRSERDLTATQFPALVLIVSGGHTELVLMRDHLQYEPVGQTRDDAAGECFDKTARLLGLSYPGGPALAKLAETGDPQAFDFPRPMINSGDCDFSFSGLKTAVYYTVSKVRKVSAVRDFSNCLTSEGGQPKRPNQAERSEAGLTSASRADLAASIQAAIVDVLIAKTITAAKKYQVKTVMISGGVAANKVLRQTMEQRVQKELSDVIYRQPNLDLATDNAGMIAIAGVYRYLRGDTKNWYDVEVDVNASLI